MTTSQEIRDRLDQLDATALTAVVRAMTNLADVLDELDDPSRVAARQIRRHLADALTAEWVAR